MDKKSARDSGSFQSDHKAEDPTVEALMQRLAELPPIRKELVSRIKREIAQGRYETPEKLDIAIERLREDLW